MGGICTRQSDGFDNRHVFIIFIKNTIQPLNSATTFSNTNSTNQPSNTNVMYAKTDYSPQRIPSSRLKSSRSPNKPRKSIVNDVSIQAHLDLSDGQKELITKYWREYISVERRDIFHRTMLFCIEASPKLNEIIACGHYCFRDLTKWPKLNRICQAQFTFFDRLINDLKLDEGMVYAESKRLGIVHAQYAQFGLKPHFLDIFQQQFIGLLCKAKCEDEEERREMIIAYTKLTSFIIEVMNFSYMQSVSKLRLGEKNEKNGA